MSTLPGRRVDGEPARLARGDEAVLDAHGDGADGAVAAHRQAARGLDEEHRHVAVGPGRRIEDRARHHVVAARLEHQAGADPVELAQEMRALLQHGGALEPRPAAGDQADRIAAGVAVDAGEGVGGHGLRTFAARRGQGRSAGARPVTRSATSRAVPARLGEAEVAVAEGVDDARRGAGAADGRQAVGQRRAEAHPLHAALGLQPGQEAPRLAAASPRRGGSSGGSSSPPSSTAPPTRMPVDEPA